MVIKNNKGITLVALVITIVVMLILAGITLSLVFGQNGIITRAKEASRNYNAASEEELAALSDLEEFLDDSMSNTPITRANLKVGSTSLTKNKTSEAFKNYYGETVTGFSSVEGVTWQLFYDDENYVFLIASDYVEKTKLPSELIRGGDYELWFIYYRYGDSSFSSNITGAEPWKNGTGSTSITTNPLTNKYLSWATTHTSTKNRLKATAYMMDVSKWSDFAGNVTGAFAIGGPTLEMYVKSWNAAHDSTKQIPTPTQEDDGYYISTVSTFGTGAGDLGSTTNMWCIIDDTKADGCWIASPGRSVVEYLWRARYDGRLYLDAALSNTGYTYAHNENTNGFRPLVAIPKTSL